MWATTNTAKAFQQVRQNARISRSKRRAKWLEREVVPAALGRTVTAR